MTSFTAVLLILCLSAAAAFRYVPFSRQCVASILKRQDFFQLKATQISSPDLELVTPSYRFAIGAAAVGSSLVVVAHNILGALPFLGLAGLLLVQTGRVRFGFDKEALEVFVSKTDSTEAEDSGESIEKSGENFAVGGANRWKYSAFTEWGFLPSRALPLFMYFKEKQTNGPQGNPQFHLFPVIMNAAELDTQMTNKVGKLNDFK